MGHPRACDASSTFHTYFVNLFAGVKTTALWFCDFSVCVNQRGVRSVAFTIDYAKSLLYISISRSSGVQELFVFKLGNNFRVFLNSLIAGVCILWWQNKVCHVHLFCLHLLLISSQFIVILISSLITQTNPSAKRCSWLILINSSQIIKLPTFPR